MYTHLLYPTDGSDCALYALDTVIALARGSKARVTVLHALRPPFPISAPALGLSPSQLLSAGEISEMLERQARELSAQTVEKLTAAGLEADALILHQDPRQAIVDSVQTLGCDLIVMGTHHHSALRRALLGSVSSYIAHHAPAPLLLVPLSADKV